jgi:hypothetical protein
MEEAGFWCKDKHNEGQMWNDDEWVDDHHDEWVIITMSKIFLMSGMTIIRNG